MTANSRGSRAKVPIACEMWGPENRTTRAIRTCLVGPTHSLCRGWSHAPPLELSFFVITSKQLLPPYSNEITLRGKLTEIFFKPYQSTAKGLAQFVKLDYKIQLVIEDLHNLLNCITKFSWWQFELLSRCLLKYFFNLFVIILGLYQN